MVPSTVNRKVRRRRSRACSSERHRRWHQPHVRRAHGVARCSPKQRTPVWRRHAQGHGARAPVGGVHRNSHLAALEGPIRQPHPGAARQGVCPLPPLASTPSCCSLRSGLRGQGCSERPPSPRAAWFRAGLGARGCGSCAGEPRPSSVNRSCGAVRHESEALSQAALHPYLPPHPKPQQSVSAGAGRAMARAVCACVIPPTLPFAADPTTTRAPCPCPCPCPRPAHPFPRASLHAPYRRRRCCAHQSGRSRPHCLLRRDAAAMRRQASGACGHSCAVARQLERPCACAPGHARASPRLPVCVTAACPAFSLPALPASLSCAQPGRRALRPSSRPAASACV